MKWERLCELGRELPEVVEDVWYRTPALKVRGKGFVRLKEDGETVVFVVDSVDEQEALIAAMPAVYFITDHYRGYPAVLARLAALRVGEARARLERGWRARAPRALTAALLPRRDLDLEPVAGPRDPAVEHGQEEDRQRDAGQQPAERDDLGERPLAVAADGVGERRRQQADARDQRGDQDRPQPDRRALAGRVRRCSAPPRAGACWRG